jgi:two-component system response regulator BaeR
MIRPKRILIIEDEPDLTTILRDYMVQWGMVVECLAEGTDAVETIFESNPDLVILDLMLPGKDGVSIIREVRAHSNVPIIVETARIEEIDRLLGLELGADDYVCKPFSPRELVARVRNILRRIDNASDERVEQPGSSRLRLDEKKWVAMLDVVSIDLTRREFQILAVLYGRPGQVFSRSQLLDHAFGEEIGVVDRTIDSHIKNIRLKIRAVNPTVDFIRSVYGVGYAFEKEPE